MPTRDFDLLDGGWYASQPYADWAWMREHAPAYWDAKNEVWALTRYDDVLAVEKDPATFSSHRAPRPHGSHLPMMISMDVPEHSRRRKLVSRGFTPRRVREHEPTIRRICTEIIDRVAPEGRVRLRVGHRRAAPAPAHRRHARLPARVVRRPACAGPTT